MESKTFTEEEIFKIIDEFEKENTNVLKTEDLVKKKIVISDYVKWDDFRKLKNKFMTAQGFRRALERGGFTINE